MPFLFLRLYIIIINTIIDEENVMSQLTRRYLRKIIREEYRRKKINEMIELGPNAPDALMALFSLGVFAFSSYTGIKYFILYAELRKRINSDVELREILEEMGYNLQKGTKDAYEIAQDVMNKDKRILRKMIDVENEIRKHMNMF